ncbi:MAG: hypothetical protein AABX66_00445 [Nanoarchaeota archaeon]
MNITHEDFVRAQRRIIRCVIIGDYSLRIRTKVHFFEGEDGSQENQSGWFMKQEISLVSVSGEDGSLIRQMGKMLPLLIYQSPMSSNKEITTEPAGYEFLCSREFVKNVEAKPHDYITHES